MTTIVATYSASHRVSLLDSAWTLLMECIASFEYCFKKIIDSHSIKTSPAQPDGNGPAKTTYFRTRHWAICKSRHRVKNEFDSRQEHFSPWTVSLQSPLYSWDQDSSWQQLYTEHRDCWISIFNGKKDMKIKFRRAGVLDEPLAEGLVFLGVCGLPTAECVGRWTKLPT